MASASSDRGDGAAIFTHFRLRQDRDGAFAISLAEDFGRVFPLEAARITDCPWAFLRAIHPADRRRVRETLQAAVRGGEAWRLIFRTNRGQPRSFLAQASVHDDGDGREWRGMLTDVTELESARETAIEDAEAARREAAAKSEFLATMSHEIRTPMNGVIGMTSLLLDTPLTAQQREFAEIIRGSGESLIALINDILEFSRIEAGKLKLEDAAFSLHECVESAIDVIAPRAAEKGLELLYAIEPRLPAELHGDPTRLRQIMVNLLGNAVKFTEAGEIELTVTQETDAAGSPRIVFRVRDTGIGIPPAVRKNLFRAFGQATAATARQFGGTGLGLVISKRLAELMEGAMWFDSEAGRGSTFAFSIARRTGTGAAPEPAPEPFLQHKQVFVCDDNATSRRQLAAILENLGGNVTAFATVEELVREAKNAHRPDLLVIDLPCSAGQWPSVKSELRALLGTETPFLILAPLNQQPAMTTKHSALLHKPCKPAALRTIVQQLLSGANIVDTEKHGERFSRARHFERVLLAEDNLVNQKVALHLLNRLGFFPHVVDNGAEAVAAAGEKVFDIILMDVQMPVMDGLEATRRIRELTRRATVRPHIVALTANATAADREACLEAGMDDFLPKPVQLLALSEMMARACAAVAK
jgi:signal transduction histidine kinase/CheY-like chemotaxis protein